MCLQTAQATLFQEDRDDVDDLCIVCWERVREVIFYNCMHMVRSTAYTFSICCPYVAMVFSVYRVNDI